MKILPLLPLLGVTATLLPAAVTSHPPTLLEITGAHSSPGRLSGSVVVIIDAQRDYLATGKLPLSGIGSALHQTHRLLERARAAHVPIIHIQQLSPRSRGIFGTGTPAIEFAAEAAPAAGETIITKQLPNAFAGTTLDETLRQLGRKELIISGYMTHMCVSATVRSALDHGYHATVIADACATRDIPGINGDTVPAATVHHVALAELSDRFATVVANLEQVPD